MPLIFALLAVSAIAAAGSSCSGVVPAKVCEELPGYFHLVGVQPENLEVGLGSGETVQGVIPQVVNFAGETLPRQGRKKNRVGG